MTSGWYAMLMIYGEPGLMHRGSWKGSPPCFFEQLDVVI